MIEVFKTNVNSKRQADMLVSIIQHTFVNYQVHFDLEDCDKILRVKCPNGDIDQNSLIRLLKSLGYHSELLPDEVPSSRATPIIMV